MIAMKWPLARITQTHAGKDGVVRVVILETPTGVYATCYKTCSFIVW